MQIKDFRPLDFDSVLGLEYVKQFFQEVLRKEDYDPAYLFSGSLSSGKTTLARIFSRAALCESRKEDMSPCNECASCRSFLERRNWGYTEIDAANNSGKETVKDLMDSIQFESVSKRRFILFDEAQNMSEEAKDAILKTIDDPIPGVILIFCTTAVEKITDTLRSRCIEFHFNQPSEQNVFKKLKNVCNSMGLGYEDEALHLITRSVNSYYRFAENRVKTIKRFGDINLENTKKVVLNYDEEIAEMLINLSYDLPSSLATAEVLASKVAVKNIYSSVLRLITDSLKLSMGLGFESSSYESILKKIHSQFGDSLYEILSYLMSKTKFVDVTYLQSDLLVLSYKFTKGHFSPKKSVPVSEKPSVAVPQKEAKPEANSLAEIAKLPTWKREDAVREIRRQMVGGNKDERVEETVSSHWGPEKEDKIPPVQMKSLSPSEFRKVLKGDLNGGKI